MIATTEQACLHRGLSFNSPRRPGRRSRRNAVKHFKRFAITAAAAAMIILGAGSAALAQGNSANGFEVSLLSGVQALNKNDTSLVDHLVNIPVSATVAYHFTPVLAAEGDFTYIIPVKQKVDVGTGTKVDAKSPDLLAYQANLRATLPLQNASWQPYATAGAGAITFLSNDSADRMPRLAKAETAFAINFGLGTTYQVNGPWGLRADFRGFVAFPSNSTAGLSVNGLADNIWMERGTLGVTYRF